MNKIIMLLLTLSISTFFIHVPHVGQVGFALNEAVKLSYNQYFWMVCQHLIMIVLSLIICDEAKDYRLALNTYVWIQIADLLMFVLAYSDPLGNYILNWNVLKLLIFAGVLIIEWKPWKEGSIG